MAFMRHIFINICKYILEMSPVIPILAELLSVCVNKNAYHNYRKIFQSPMLLERPPLLIIGLHTPRIQM
jgi:hypothetical protein